MFPFEVFYFLGLAGGVSVSFFAWGVGGIVSFMINNNPFKNKAIGFG